MAFVAPSSYRSDALIPGDKLEKLSELVRRVFGCDLRASPMPGGASTRRYFRVALSGGESAVAVYVPLGGRPEEVQPVEASPVGKRWPFLEVRDLLAEHGIDVPAVLAEDTAHGWIVIEDLGDLTLAKWLERRPQDREAFYRRAVRDLARAQNELAALPSSSVVSAREFDADLLFWEIEHFREWVLEARGKPLSAADRPRWNVLAERLADRVAALPRGFVHRDYQSRNLMVVPQRAQGSSEQAPRLVWIDFQDALLGPRVYDLVALLTDSHQEFDRAFVEARLADYADAAELASDDRRTVAEEFDLVMVQRKMKSAGRFMFVDRKKGNAAFLRFVPPTVRKIGDALARLAERDPGWRELRAILVRTLGEECSG